MSIEREPIFWTSTNAGANQRERERVRFEGGEKIVERVPQRGHQGDYEDKRPAKGVRSVRVVRIDGHSVDHHLTTAAAMLDPTTSMGQYQVAKMRHLGWFPIGRCPCALLTTGELQAGHIVDQKVAKDRPCDPGTYNEKKPCKHSLAEQLARQSLHGTKEAKRMAGFKDPTAQLVESSQAQTAAIVGAITDALGSKAK